MIFLLLQKILCENASRTAESSCLKMNEPRISLIFAYQAFEIVTVLGSKKCCSHSNYAKVNRVP